MASHFAAVHMQKFKIGAVKGIQFHNQRERNSKTNKDIDPTKTEENYDLKNENKINYVRKVDEIIKNNVQTDRAIRKDAVVMCNFVVSSDKEFFEQMDEKATKSFFKESYEFFKEKYGEENIVACTVHMDEKTPHMHLSLVPVTEDHKLSAKRLFDRTGLRNVQEDYPKYMQSKGFDIKRGMDSEGVNKHIDTQKLKLIELEERNKLLLEENKKLEKELEHLKSEIQTPKLIMKTTNDIPRGSRAFGKVILKSDEYTKLRNDVEAFYNEKIQKEEFERKNIGLQQKLNTEINYSNNLVKESNKLNKDIEQLKLEYLKLQEQRNLCADFINKIPKEIKTKLPLKELIEKTNNIIKKPYKLDKHEVKREEIKERIKKENVAQNEIQNKTQIKPKMGNKNSFSMVD